MLDTKQIAAALIGLKPKPTRIAAVIATGAPNPAAPSKKALKENPINLMPTQQKPHWSQ